MAPLFRRIDRYWDWQLSARFRIGSLASAWALILLMPVLGWIVLPLSVIRSAASFVQAGLNIRLGKHVPVRKQNRWDWALIGSIFVLAYLGAGVSYATGMSNYSWQLVVPLLLPFTALQLRMVSRSNTAHRSVETRPAAVLRLEDYRRGGAQVAEAERVA